MLLRGPGEGRCRGEWGRPAARLLCGCPRLFRLWCVGAGPGGPARTWGSALLLLVLVDFQMTCCVTESPTSEVVAVPCRSAVTWPEFRTASTAAFTAAASSFRPKLYSSMAATDPMAPKGLALF